MTLCCLFQKKIKKLNKEIKIGKTNTIKDKGYNIKDTKGTNNKLIMIISLS